MWRIEVTRDTDKLNRKKWSFLYLGNRHTLALTDYIQQTRPTSRRKFQAVEAWSAYQDKRRQYGHDDVALLDTPPLPADVSAEAIEEFTKTLKVTDHF